MTTGTGTARRSSDGGARRGLTINKGRPRQVFNRLIGRLLRSRLHGLAGLSEMTMLLTYTGRKSGARYTLPLSYLREGATITTIALFTNTVWWKNLRGGAPVTVRVQGRERAGRAEAIEDPAAVAEAWRRMAERHPAATRGGYYGVPRQPDGRIDGSALLDLARTRVLVRIALDEAPAVGATTAAHTGQQFSGPARLGFRLFTGLHATAYRLTGGRFGGTMGAAPVLVLTTTGRKSGKARATPLLYLPDDGRMIVVASMGGAPQNPAWWHNLRADPAARVQIGGRSIPVRARDATGAERDQLWARLVALFPRYDEYRQATTRQIPVVILEPLSRD